MNDELENCLAAAEERLDRAMFEKDALDLQCDALAKEVDRLRIEIAVASMTANDFDDSMLGENMARSIVLAAALNKQEMKVRRAFSRLEPEERDHVEAVFRRHAVACQRSGIPIDPSFIREAIDDAMFEHSSYRAANPEPISKPMSRGDWRLARELGLPVYYGETKI